MRRVCATIFVAVLWSLAGCNDQPTQSAQTAQRRYVSLSPAITDMMVKSHVGDLLVGRSAYCRDAVDLPVAGDLENINAEMLVRLHPTHIFVQRRNDDIDAGLLKLADQHQWEIIAQPLKDLEDVVHFLHIFAALDGRSMIKSQCQLWKDQIAASLVPQATPSGTRVMIVSGGPAPLAWGGQTYVGEVLTAAGGVNVLPDSAWQAVSHEDIARLAPELLLVIGQEARPEDWPSACGEVVPLRQKWLDMPGPHVAEIRREFDQLLASRPAYTD